MKETIHITVLKKEMVDNVVLVENGLYVDATLGGGGHTLALADKIIKEGKNGKIISIDQDKKAIERFKKRLDSEGFEQENGNYVKKTISIKLVNDNFGNLEDIIKDDTKIDGLMADLGLSTDQLEEYEKGFSYKDEEAELDLRMSSELKVKAQDLLNGLFKNELKKMFSIYGDITFANRLAKQVIKFREKDKIKKVKHLNTIIENAAYSINSRNVKARVYQALRIAVNDELGNLERLLNQGYKLLNWERTMSIISFHSGEDRVVKQFFKAKEDKSEGIMKMIYPTEEEIKLNSKASSAKMRVFNKVKINEKSK
jgi:16S rRNA (cytosine1402-N4)-methyltransferase